MNDETNALDTRAADAQVRRQVRLFGALLGGFLLLLVVSLGLDAWQRHVAPGAFRALLDTLGSLARSFAILGLLIAGFLALISFALAMLFPVKPKAAVTEER
jgi:hypothetical protein